MGGGGVHLNLSPSCVFSADGRFQPRGGQIPVLSPLPAASCFVNKALLEGEHAHLFYSSSRAALHAARAEVSNWDRYLLADTAYDGHSLTYSPKKSAGLGRRQFVDMGVGPHLCPEGPLTALQF